ncbi:MAG: DUF3048 domain-containing protein [Anaerolineales bacterium]
MKRIFPWLALAVLMGGALAGCSGFQIPPAAYAMSTQEVITIQAPTDTPTPIPPTATAEHFKLKPTSTPLPSATPFVSPLHYKLNSFSQGIDPLTDLPVSNLSLLQRRPMAVKVTNFPRSVRPQWGLSLADNVYEYYLENLITRFIGVFYGQDASRVGPVRSGRFFDEHIVRMYKSIFVFAYADDRVVKPWTEYNTLYVNTQQLTQYINDRGTNNDRQDLNGFVFDAYPPISNQPGEKVSVYYSFVSYNQWVYDPATHRYLRFQETQDAKDGQEAYAPLTDSLTGEQLAADNLVVLLIPHEYYIHTKTTEMVKMKFFGSGDAYAFRDGKMYAVRWERDQATDLLQLKFPDGLYYPLKPGNIWFEVLGETSNVMQKADHSWRFEFAIP